MATPKEMLERFKQVNLPQLIREEITNNPKPAIQLNQEQLYIFGENSKGDKLRNYYSQEYAGQKNAQNPQPGFGIPDLFLTGAFYRGWFLEVQGDKLMFGSRDKITPKLVAKYGPAIFGLNRHNTSVYRIVIYLSVVERVKQITGCI